MAKELTCWNCGKSISDVPLPISRHANCSHCFEVLHCCRMCIHFRDRDHLTCDHDRAEPPVVKEGANFCDYFRPAHGTFDASGRARASTARSKLDALFDGDEETDVNPVQDGDMKKNGPQDDARSRLDDLFD